VRPFRRPAALAIVAALGLLAACGSTDDGSGASPTTTASPVATTTADGASDSTSAAPADGGPNATISPDVPAEFLDSVGPVEVTGESLPMPATDDGAADPAVGTAAPVLVGVGFDGTTVRIDAAENGPTMVVFVAHWCSHCNAEIPRLNELRDEGRISDDLNVVAVATASAPDRPNYPPGSWLSDMDWTYPAMPDGIDMERQTWIAADAFGVSGFPFIVLIDGNGDVAARWSGEREPDEVAAMISEALGL
jgi:cytochrome c biogenesis protein CcmG/thiol:disulfide interchange protein DsbE